MKFPDELLASPEFADRHQLTPLLESLQGRPHEALKRNAIRVERIATAYAEIAPALDHVVLKGFTHVPDFTPELNQRVQYDLDLYVPPSEKERARDALLALGYEPIGRMEGLAMDHLPTMVRKTGWQWRGDYLDPDLPPAVEVHFRFWDPETERLPADGVDDFWTRRCGHQLALVDKLGYAALHLTRHLLRGNVKAFHVWELANFLDTHRDPAFWAEWRALHSPSVRRLEAVAFLLAKSWFDCAIEVEEIAQLPPDVHRWFDRYRWSPIQGSNKHELWLHTSLVATTSDRVAILRRRLIPASLPGPIDAIHIPRMTLARRLRAAIRNTTYAASRAVHHIGLFVPTVFEGIKWWFHSA
ncbi:MAG TPA: nucleotidyltransferase family protein [Bryobacteraceae bacterium]|nr:nucleotidyltransferase family protein [Bryobacteraceae bacterium]